MAIIFQQLVRDNGGALPTNTTSPPVNSIPSQGLLVDDQGAVFVSSGPIETHAYGLPFDEYGALVVGGPAATRFDQGLPFTASGQLCIAAGTPDGYNQGLGFVGSALAAT